MESEKEKMGTGRLYDANYDTELIAERQVCKELCYELNRLRPSQITEREAIIRRLLHKTKEHFLLEQPFYCDYGYNIEIGENFYANMNLHPCNCKLRIKPREKIRVCYLIFLMSEKLSKQDKDKWKAGILKLLDIDDSYYKSKYKEPVSDFPSDSNQNFAKEMEHIFR